MNDRKTPTWLATSLLNYTYAAAIAVQYMTAKLMRLQYMMTAKFYKQSSHFSKRWQKADICRFCERQRRREQLMHLTKHRSCCVVLWPISSQQQTKVDIHPWPVHHAFLIRRPIILKFCGYLNIQNIVCDQLVRTAPVLSSSPLNVDPSL